MPRSFVKGDKVIRRYTVEAGGVRLDAFDCGEVVDTDINQVRVKLYSTTVGNRTKFYNRDTYAKFVRSILIPVFVFPPLPN